MTSTADYKAKTPGYTPAPNRYFARQHGVVGKTTTKDWNIQKKAVTGYTAASDQYFATKQRLAYHPADKTLTVMDSKQTVQHNKHLLHHHPHQKWRQNQHLHQQNLKALCQKVSMLNLHQNQTCTCTCTNKTTRYSTKRFHCKTCICTTTCKSKGHTSKRILIFKIFYFLSCT